MSGNDVGTSSRTSWKGKILVTVPVNFSFGCYCPDIYSGGKNHIASWAMLGWWIGESAEVIDLWPNKNTVPRVNVQLIGVYYISSLVVKDQCIVTYPSGGFSRTDSSNASKTAPGPADQLFLCIGEAETRHLKQERFLLRMQLGLVVGIQPCLSMSLENVAFVDGIPIHKKSIVKSELVPEEASIHVRSTLSKIKSPLNPV